MGWMKWLTILLYWFGYFLLHRSITGKPAGKNALKKLKLKIYWAKWLINYLNIFNLFQTNTIKLCNKVWIRCQLMTWTLAICARNDDYPSISYVLKIKNPKFSHLLLRIFLMINTPLQIAMKGVIFFQGT